MDALIHKLQQDFPGVVFRESHRASWSPNKQQVSYRNKGKTPSAWSILHEMGHAILGHNAYASDLDLLRKEIAAWQQARTLAVKYDIAIDDSFVEDCLDTYRDWIHKRSTCPKCDRQGIQQARHRYHCLNCDNTWAVSVDRFCRPYRLQTKEI